CGVCYWPRRPALPSEKLYIFLHAIWYPTSLGMFEIDMPEWVAEGRNGSVFLDDVVCTRKGIPRLGVSMGLANFTSEEALMLLEQAPTCFSCSAL
ncbi:hypothetical protein BC827DRAFT_1139501, partial [Russula dissimulans]